MLQKIRDGASGPLAYVVVGIITVVFGVWGIGSYFTPSSDPTIATAGEKEITQSELQRAFDQRYQQLRQMMGDSFDSSVFPPGEVRQSVLQRLIDEAVVTQYADQKGYRVSDGDLLAYIRDNPQFQQNGEFSAERYRTLLANSGVQPAQYEARLRQALLGEQVRQVLNYGAFSVAPEVNQAYAEANTQRNVKLVRFQPDTDSDNKISDEAVREFYRSHQSDFMQPERVKLSYVSLNANTLDVPDTFDEQTLRQLYQNNQQAFGTPEKRSGEVLRVAIEGDNGDAQARQTVSKIQNTLRENESASLSGLAKKADNASVQTIDSEPRSALPDAVASALFALDKGELSNPVHTDSAWYLVRMSGKTAAETPAFDDPEVQERLKTMAVNDRRDELFAEKADTLEDLAYQAPNDLKTISDSLNLDPQTTDWITADGGPGIGQYDAVRQSAFSDAVLKDGLNSKVLTLGNQRKVVLRVAEHEAAKPRDLAEVQDDIRARLKTRRAAEQAQQAARQAMQALKNGTPIGQVADDNENASLDDLGYIGRQDSRVDPALAQAIFSTGLSGENETASGYDIAQSADGLPVVIAINGQRLNDTSGQGSADQRKQQIANQQRQYNASLEYAAFDRYLVENADVEIEKDSLRRSQGAD